MIVNWVFEEMKSLNIGDKRLNIRMMELLTASSKQPQASLNKMFHTRKEVQACYRFFSNDMVDEDKIIKPHLEKTIERVSSQPVVLTLSDTTSLNYTSRKKLADSGYISSNNAQGFFAHVTLAVTPERLSLGIVGKKFWAREKEKKTRTSKERERMMFSEKESYRWLEAYFDSCNLAAKCKTTQIVHITDREGDIFEIYEERAQRELKNQPFAEYIIRSSHNRTVHHPDKSTNHLYDELEKSPILAEIGFDVIDRDDNSTRRVHQSVHAKSVTIKSRYGADSPQVRTKLNVIYLKEIDPPEGVRPIIWCLITSLPITTQAEIMKNVEYYLCRWEIELLFKTYKSGCKVEQKSLRSAERLYPLFALFLIVAWRVNFILHAGRVIPNVSCDVFFEESEWKAAYVAATRDKSSLPKDPPTIKQMTYYIAKLGGYLGRKSDAEPGIKYMWIGLSALHNYADAWDLFGPGAKT